VDDERLTDLEIKLAYQEQLIRELDTLVRSFGTRLDEATRELAQLRDAIRSPEAPPGPAGERPQHY